MITSGAEFRISSISWDCSILMAFFLGAPLNVRRFGAMAAAAPATDAAVVTVVIDVAVVDGTGDGLSYLAGTIDS